MLLQTNSYIVPKDKRAEHARLLRRFRQVLTKLGCDNFEVYEQVGANWGTGESTGRVVQIMRFRDRKHQLAVQSAERNDPAAQALIAEFCELINFPYQQQRGLFAVGFYGPVLTTPLAREQHEPQETTDAAETAEGPVSHEEYEVQPEDADAPPPAGVVEAGAAAADALVEEGALEAPQQAVEATQAAVEVTEPDGPDTAEPLGAETGAAPEPAEPEQQEAVVAEPERATDGPGAEGLEAVASDAPRADEAEAARADAPQPEASAEPTENNGHIEEMDLSALLDPHLDHDDRGDLPPPLPHATDGGNGTPPGHRPEIDLSMEGLLDDEGPSPDDTGTPSTSPDSRQNLAHGATRA
jgi:hypothetical protein